MDDIRVNLLVDELVTNFSSQKKNSHLWRRFADGTEDFCIRGRYYPILRRSLVVRDYENSQSPFILTFQDLPKVPTNKNADFQEDAILKDYLLMDLDGPDSNNKLRFAFSSDTHDNAYVVTSLQHCEVEAYFLLRASHSTILAVCLSSCRIGNVCLSGLAKSVDEDFVTLVNSMGGRIHGNNT